MKTAVTVLVMCVAGLLALGLVMLYSASFTRVGARLFLQQLAWAGAGVIAAVFLAWIDYRRFKPWVWAFWGLAVVALALVLVPQIGAWRNGARRWFDFGAFQVQPSEGAKLVLIMALAYYAERNQQQMRTFHRGIVIPGLLIGVVLGLIVVEDRGTTILLGAVAVGVLLASGIRWVFLAPPLLLAVAALAVLLWTDPVRRARIESWWKPEMYRESTGYQSWQSIVAFGSGGWKGLGLGNSRQKLGFVPEHQTDFIFSIIGEELGLVATLGVVAGFMGIALCGFYIASRAADPFGGYLACGITLLISLQAAINIGVVTGTLPNKGLSLPFISYGGSNLLLMLSCTGILLSIARRSGEKPEESAAYDWESDGAMAMEGA